MARLGERTYSFRIPYRRVLERARAQEARLPAYIDGAVATPSAGTYTLYGPDGSRVVNAQIVSFSDDGAALYTLSAGELPAALALGEGYLEEWSLVMPDGSTRTPRVLVALAKRQLFPVITDEDLTRDYPTLNAQRGTLLENWQGYIDSAWEEILRRLTREGAWSYLAVDASAFFDVHYHLTLKKIFAWFMQKNGAEKSEGSCKLHGSEYDRAWSHLATAWDHDHDGLPEDATEIEAVPHSLQPAGAPAYYVGCGNGRW